MISKGTFSIPGVWKPSASEKEKKLAGPCEVSSLKLSSGGGSAVVALYNASDSSGAIEANLLWFLDCSTTDNDIQTFPNPLKADKGIYAICEQGWDFNPVVCLSVIK